MEKKFGNLLMILESTARRGGLFVGNFIGGGSGEFLEGRFGE